MHTKQLLKSKWNLYCIHFLFLSRDWASLAPHSSKFHASPLNPAYWKCLLSFFPPSCLTVGFWNSNQSNSLHGRKENYCPAFLSPLHAFLGTMLCDGQDLGISLSGDPTCRNPTLFHGPRGEILVLGILKNAIGQIQSASHTIAGDLFPYLWNLHLRRQVLVNLVYLTSLPHWAWSCIP